MDQIQVETLVIGAGMAGLSCATVLAESGHEVLVVDKARGSGGRIASKSLTLGDGQQVVFDLGCAGIAAQTRTFLEQLQHWHEAGLVESWRKVGGIVEYVGKPRNSKLTRSLADQLDTRFSLRIERLEWHEGVWLAHAMIEGRLMPVIRTRHVVLATPAEQAAALMAAEHPFRGVVSEVQTLPQWVVIVVTDEIECGPDYQEMLNQSPVIRSIVCDSQKPGRQSIPGHKVWQIQLRADWSDKHREAKIAEVYQAVLDELKRVTGTDYQASEYYVHRWLYSSGHRHIVQTEECLWDPEQRLGVCGDYFYHPELAADGVRRFGVESAFLSGRALAARMTD